MPIIKSAIKKLRADKRKTDINNLVRKAYKTAIKTMRREPSLANLKKAASELDRAAKKHVIHRSKSSRLKSRLSRLIAK